MDRCLLNKRPSIRKMAECLPAKHVPAPVVVAILARDEGNAIRLAGGPRLRLTVDGKRTLAGSAGLYKLVLLDIGSLSVSHLLGRDVDPIDAYDLGEAER